MQNLNKNKLKLKITSHTSNLMLVRDFIADAAKNFGFDDENINKIIMAVDEACTNIIKHAYGSQPGQPIDIAVSTDNKKFSVIIKDKGKYFEPKEICPPDMREYLKQYKVGGLGIHLMKSLMDEIKYKIQPGVQNEVKLVKYLPGNFFKH